MTATKPLPPHGTTARAKGRPSAGIKGCPCLPCRDAENHYSKRRRYLNDTGRTFMVPAAPVAEHLRTLFAAGAGWNQLRDVAESSNATISGILHGKSAKIRRTTANKFLAIQPGDATPPGRRVPAVGAIRRTRALLAIGHSCKAIYNASTVQHSKISILLGGTVDTVPKHVHERIALGYTKLAVTPGTSMRSFNRAARQGWPSPAAWDDIDDPQAVPDTGRNDTELGRRELAALRREEITHLAAYSIPENEIAARLAMAPAYVHDLIRDMKAAA